MLLSEAEGRKVVSLATAETVGKVSDYVIDAKARTVAALVLKKSEGSGDTLPWEQIHAFGDEAIMVASADDIVEASGHVAELREKRFRAHGKRVLTTTGVELGKVDDVEFDPETGQVVALLVNGEEVPGVRLLATGSWAVIVSV